jgi:hypothetical protein
MKTRKNIAISVNNAVINCCKRGCRGVRHLFLRMNRGKEIEKQKFNLTKTGIVLAVE